MTQSSGFSRRKCQHLMSSTFRENNLMRHIPTKRSWHLSGLRMWFKIMINLKRDQTKYKSINDIPQAISEGARGIQVRPNLDLITFEWRKWRSTRNTGTAFRCLETTKKTSSRILQTNDCWSLILILQWFYWKSLYLFRRLSTSTGLPRVACRWRCPPLADSADWQSPLSSWLPPL